MIQFSQCAKTMRPSEIRRLMALAANPSIISFAGGMPNNDLFPWKATEELYRALSEKEKKAAFQYGPTQGYPPLLSSLQRYLESRNIMGSNNKILMTTGAQQAINLLSKMFLDEGDIVITEYPSFIGALAAFNSYGATLHGVPMDNEGIILDQLEEAIKRYGSKIKFVYLCPYFQNPKGTIYSNQRKKEVCTLLARYQIPLLEDDPYGELYFDEAMKPLTQPMKSLYDTMLPIIYVGSFAKIFGPGMRLGYMVAPEEIYDKCELAKQSMDACSSTFTQVLADAFLTSGQLTPYLEFLRPIYKRRAAITIEALEKSMPKGISWTTAQGGFYLWVEMPENIDSSAVLSKSIEKGAAFVIGNAFDPEARRNNNFRIAFSHTPEDKIATGITIIADAIKEIMAQ